jgi:hypothetical protein
VVDGLMVAVLCVCRGRSRVLIRKLLALYDWSHHSSLTTWIRISLILRIRIVTRSRGRPLLILSRLMGYEFLSSALCDL